MSRPPFNFAKTIEKLDKQLANAHTRVIEIQAHIAALQRITEGTHLK